MKVPKITVIVAVYNVEDYIENCAVSLFNQTLGEIEYIFVDDCSTDRSIERLKNVVGSFPNRQPYVKIIQCSKNNQVAYARTLGMKNATGDFVIHCDPDDYIDADYYETVYRIAKSTGSDIVATNYYKETKNSTIEIKGNYYSSNPQECIAHLYEKYFFPSFCSHLVKRSLYTENDIYPYEGVNTGEDLNVLLRVFYYAKKLTYIDKAYYHYVMRDSSLTHNKDVMTLWNNNISKNLEQIIHFFESRNENDYALMLNYLKFTKKQILLSANPPRTQMWYNIYPECRKDIFKFSNLSISRRLLYFIFSYLYPILNLYFKFRY